MDQRFKLETPTAQQESATQQLSFELNGHTQGFHQQTQKIEPLSSKNRGNIEIEIWQIFTKHKLHLNCFMEHQYLTAQLDLKTKCNF